MTSSVCCITWARESKAPALGDKAVKVLNAEVEGFASGQKRQPPESNVFFVSGERVLMAL